MLEEGEEVEATEVKPGDVIQPLADGAVPSSNHARITDNCLVEHEAAGRSSTGATGSNEAGTPNYYYCFLNSAGRTKVAEAADGEGWRLVEFTEVGFLVDKRKYENEPNRGVLKHYLERCCSAKQDLAKKILDVNGCSDSIFLQPEQEVLFITLEAAGKVQMPL